MAKAQTTSLNTVLLYVIVSGEKPSTYPYLSTVLDRLLQMPWSCSYNQANWANQRVKGQCWWMMSKNSLDFIQMQFWLFLCESSNIFLSSSHHIGQVHSFFSNIPAFESSALAHPGFAAPSISKVHQFCCETSG